MEVTVSTLLFLLVLITIFSPSIALEISTEFSSGASFKYVDIKPISDTSSTHIPFVFKVTHNIQSNFDKVINIFNKECKEVNTSEYQQTKKKIDEVKFILDTSFSNVLPYERESTYPLYKLLTRVKNVYELLNRTYIYPYIFDDVDDKKMFKLLSVITYTKELNFTFDSNFEIDINKKCNIFDIQIQLSNILMTLIEYETLQTSCKHNLLDENIIKITDNILQDFSNLLENKFNKLAVLSSKKPSDYYKIKMSQSCIYYKNQIYITLDIPVKSAVFDNGISVQFKATEFSWGSKSCKINIPEQPLVIFPIVDNIVDDTIIEVICDHEDPNYSTICSIDRKYVNTMDKKCIKNILKGGNATEFSKYCPLKCKENTQNFIILGYDEPTNFEDGITFFRSEETIIIKCAGNKDYKYTLKNANIGTYFLQLPCNCVAKIDFVTFDITPTMPCSNSKDAKIIIKHLVPIHWLKEQSSSQIYNFNSEVYNVNMSSQLNWEWSENTVEIKNDDPPLTYLQTSIIGVTLHFVISLVAFYFFCKHRTYGQSLFFDRGLLNRGVN